MKFLAVATISLFCFSAGALEAKPHPKKKTKVQKHKKSTAGSLDVVFYDHRFKVTLPNTKWEMSERNDFLKGFYMFGSHMTQEHKAQAYAKDSFPKGKRIVQSDLSIFVRDDTRGLAEIAEDNKKFARRNGAFAVSDLLLESNPMRVSYFTKKKGGEYQGNIIVHVKKMVFLRNPGNPDSQVIIAIADWAEGQEVMKTLAHGIIDSISEVSAP